MPGRWSEEGDGAVGWEVEPGATTAMAGAGEAHRRGPGHEREQELVQEQTRVAGPEQEGGWSRPGQRREHRGWPAGAGGATAGSWVASSMRRCRGEEGDGEAGDRAGRGEPGEQRRPGGKGPAEEGRGGAGGAGGGHRAQLGEDAG